MPGVRTQFIVVGFGASCAASRDIPNNHPTCLSTLDKNHKMLHVESFCPKAAVTYLIIHGEARRQSHASVSETYFISKQSRTVFESHRGVAVLAPPVHQAIYLQRSRCRLLLTCRVYALEANSISLCCAHAVMYCAVALPFLLVVCTGYELC